MKLLILLMGWIFTAPLLADDDGALFPVDHLKKMDRIIVGAGSVSNFLSHPELQSRYMSEAQKYFGATSFSEKNFYRVLKALRATIRLDPNLDRKLMSTENLGIDFSIKTNFRNSGRSFSLEAWKKFYEIYEKELQHQAASLLSQKGSDHLDWMQHSDVKAAAALSVLHFFELESIQNLIRHGSADGILEKFYDFYLDPDFFLDHGELSRDLKQAIRETFKSRSFWLEQKDIFAGTVISHHGRVISIPTPPTSTLHFRSLPRHIHSIWKEILHSKNPDKISFDVQVQIIEEVRTPGGPIHFKGMNQIPLSSTIVNQGVSSAISRAPLMEMEIFVQDSQTGLQKSITIADIWSAKMAQNLCKSVATHLAPRSP
ncbi:MAG: hypothetical protein J0L93_09225 [Deltaproteobacteria bacterium]|nr:hypothetical protein [Deltaproteobacteria bacterium]